MAILDFRARRLITAGGFAAAIALAPVLAVFAGPTSTVGTPMAACPSGETEDPFTFACVPEVVPNGGVSTPTGAPSEQQLTECSGGDQANCLEQDYYGTPGGNVPHVDESVHQSP
jgi:hypothetical protein